MPAPAWQGIDGAAEFGVGPLTEAERADIRRFCGFPVRGPTPNPFDGHRFFQSSGLLEYRMTNMTPAELQRARMQVSAIHKLEVDILGAADNLDTAQAAVWTRNPAEVRDRERLYDGWRRRLCAFLGVPPGPELRQGGSRIVV